MSPQIPLIRLYRSKTLHSGHKSQSYGVEVKTSHFVQKFRKWEMFKWKILPFWAKIPQFGAFRSKNVPIRVKFIKCVCFWGKCSISGEIPKWGCLRQKYFIFEGNPESQVQRSKMPHFGWKSRYWGNLVKNARVKAKTRILVCLGKKPHLHFLISVYLFQLLFFWQKSFLQNDILENEDGFRFLPRSLFRKSGNIDNNIPHKCFYNVSHLK